MKTCINEKNDHHGKPCLLPQQQNWRQTTFWPFPNSSNIVIPKEKNTLMTETLANVHQIIGMCTTLSLSISSISSSTHHYRLPMTSSTTLTITYSKISPYPMLSHMIQVYPILPNPEDASATTNVCSTHSPRLSAIRGHSQTPTQK
jgi:hypothetical protein